eukprot:TRINITY_DN4444_c0_g1_i1.p1 TRINITY_DN4444_c0_g1~~TRINITY_DN4444_c0_g1_i1.p1  ORF type:complete len:601 (+),score=108.92 TRINITY_DN4444_c0_g1_i1:61-1803(+)
MSALITSSSVHDWTSKHANFNILIIECDGLKARKNGSLPEVFVRLEYASEEVQIDYETEEYKPSLYPRFYEEYTLLFDDLQVPLTISVFDLKSGSRQGKLIGKTQISLPKINPNERYTEWLSLGHGDARIKVAFSAMALAVLPSNFHEASRKEAPFRFQLENEGDIKSAGFMEGTVILATKVPIAVKILYVRLVGVESVSWNDVDVINHRYQGTSTFLNKWYHGWENSSKTLEPGLYAWHFRLRAPSPLPPTYRDKFGKIKYTLQAYLDKDRHTEPTVICMQSPSEGHVSERGETKHNISIHAVLDKKSYSLEEGENHIHVGVDIEVKNLSDVKVSKIVIVIHEIATYAASDNVLDKSRVLLKMTVPSSHVRPHKSYKDTILVSLPENYNRPTLLKSQGASRIHREVLVRVMAVKDSLSQHGVKVELPLIISSADFKVKSSGSQVISMMKDLNIVTPSTPARKRKESNPTLPREPVAPPLFQSPNLTYPPKALKLKPPPVKPVPDGHLSPEHSPNVSRGRAGSRSIQMQPFAAPYNPFLTVNPFLPDSGAANNPFIAGNSASANPFQVNNPAPPKKNPFL